MTPIEPETPPHDPASVPSDEERSEMENPTAPGFLSNLWKEWIKPFLMVAVVVFSFRSAVADWNDVPTGSMRPSIIEGDRIFVNKMAYDLKFPFTKLRLVQWDDPSRGDIVVFQSPADGRRLVKRVVGLPGDEISILRGRIFLNGRPLAYEDVATPVEDYPGFLLNPHQFVEEEQLDKNLHPILLTPGSPQYREISATTVVPDGQFYLMGDNRNNSKDSRFFGTVERKLILGRAMAVAVSVDRDRHFAPRWDRFFLALP